ncbi:MAG TPA: ABC transporter permease [Pirellulales bacterium]|nr:ABC transporter permease [Pirellulales bacterium]
MQGYIASVWRCRYFWLSLVKMDLRTRYRRSVLGLGWSLLHPIAMTIVLCTVFHSLFKMNIVDYGPFLLSGLTLWNFLTSSVTQGCDCFYNGENYIRQFPAPMAIYPLRTVLGAAFHFAVALVVVILLTWGFRGFGNVPVLLSLVPSILLLLIMGWSLAVLSGFASVIFPDMKHLLDIGLQLVFYATPIIYPGDAMQEKGLSWLMKYNPVVAWLDLFRHPLLNGELPSWNNYLIVLSSVSICATLAAATLVRLQKRLVFYL